MEVQAGSEEFPQSSFLIYHGCHAEAGSRVVKSICQEKSEAWIFT